MRDLSVLRERVDNAERQLKATYAARERECGTLMQTWERIRGRFDAQEAEIARIRTEADALQQANDELSRLVDILLKSVDGNLHDASAEAVPQITALAQRLIGAEPQSAAADFARAPSEQAPLPESVAVLLRPEPAPVEAPAASQDETPEPQAAPAAVAPEPAPPARPVAVEEPAVEAPAAALTQVDEEQDDDAILLSDPLPDEPEPPADVSQTAGLRTLLTRIESAVNGRKSGVVHHIDTASKGESEETADPLDEGFEDIHRLRQEIDGLRSRLAAG